MKTQNREDTSFILFLLTDISLAKYIPKPSSVKTTKRASWAINVTYKPYSSIPRPAVRMGMEISGATIFISVAKILLKILDFSSLDLDNFTSG